MPIVHACLAAAALATVPSLRVAAVYNLTGSGQPMGRQGFYGLKLAAEEINRGGKLKVTLHQVDARSDATVGANSLRRLLRRTSVDAVVGLQDWASVNAVGAVAQKARIPYLACGPTVTGFTKRIGSHAFSMCFDDGAQSRAIARFAREVLSTRTTTVLVDPTFETTSNLAREFPKAFTALGGRWIMTINDPNPGTGEPMKFGSDSVFAATASKDAGRTVKWLRQNGFEGAILSGQSFDNVQLGQQAGFASYKVFYTTHVAYDNPDSKVRTFVRSYKSRFKEEPTVDLAALSYDALRLLSDASHRRRRGSLRDAIGATRGFEGVTGTLSFVRGSREPLKPVSVVEQLGKDHVYRATIDNP